MVPQQGRNSNGVGASAILSEGGNHESRGGADKAGPQNKTSIKRACNECRQQKLRCDVIKDPFTPCSRCRRLSFQCRIDAGFKRVEKRRAKEDQKHQIEQQNLHVNANSPLTSDIRVPGLHDDQSHGSILQGVSTPTPYPLPTEPGMPSQLEISDDSSQIPWSSIPGPRKATTFPDVMTARGNGQPSVVQQQSPFDSGSQDRSVSSILRRLDGIELDATAVDALFEQFFTYYHPYLPFLDPQKSSVYYYQCSRLLFWSIISVASRRFSSDITLLPSLCISVPKLLWTTLQSVPQNHHDVKALCILCNWPFPMSSSSLDPTFMLSGTMMHMAMQIGLHRPRNAQDFSKFKVTLTQEDIDDRMKTWMACNIISQNVATGYGQPSMTMYDWILGPIPVERFYPNLSKELRHRLRVEKLCDRITKQLYCDTTWVPETNSGSERNGILKLLGQELDQLGMELSMEGTSTYIQLYLCCAQLHLRLNVLVEQHSPDRLIPSLLLLYESCKNLLSVILHPSSTNEETVSGDTILMYCPNYIFQMTLVSAFTILKLIRSSFRNYIDTAAGKALCNSAILAVRKISITNNDLPGRLAEVIAQLWAKEYLIPPEGQSSPRGSTLGQELRLKVNGRMSMSVMFDSILEWRRGYTTFPSLETTSAAPSALSESQPQTYQPPFPQNGSSVPPVQMPQEWNLDAFPYEDTYYPITWMLDGAEEGLSLSHIPDTSPITMET